MQKIKRKYVVVTGVFFLIIGWVLSGMPYGYIPGKYDKETKKYKVWWGKKSLSPSENGYFPLYLGFEGSAGLIDSTGRIVVPLKYKDIYKIATARPEIFFIRKTNGKQGLLNKKGKEIIPVKYDYIRKALQHSDRFYGWEDSIRWSLLNTKGEQLAQTEGMAYYETWNYVAFVNDTTGRISVTVFDMQGNQLIDDPDYDYIELTHYKIPFIICRKNQSEQYLFDKQTRKMKPLDFLISNYNMLNDELIRVQRVSEDSIKNLQHPFSFYNYDIEEGSRKIYIPHRSATYPRPPYGLLDMNGEFLFPPIYDKIFILKKSKNIVIEKEKMSGVTDSTATKWIIPFKKQEITFYENLPILKVTHPGNVSYYSDYNGNIILSSKIKDVSISDEHAFIIFNKNGKQYKMIYCPEKNRFIWHRIIM